MRLFQKLSKVKISMLSETLILPCARDALKEEKISMSLHRPLIYF